MNAGGPLGIEETDGGVVLRALGLSLDPLRPAATAFVSHVHAAATSSRVFASPETLSLARSLAPDAPPTEHAPFEWEASVELPIDRAFGGGTARLTIARAGHVLGAAQLVVDHPRGRLVYTGDWSGERDGTHGAGVVVACDELVVTSTFALPIFRFPALAATMAALAEWCALRVSEGVRPVVLARTPGPAQAIARSLVARGLTVAAEEDVLRACSAFEALGCAIGPVGSAEESPRNAVLVASADGRFRSPRTAVAYASGWALLDAAVEQKRADAAFALADQADFDALVGLVEGTGAKRIHVTRGDARPFAHALRSRGLDARAIELGAIDDRSAS